MWNYRVVLRKHHWQNPRTQEVHVSYSYEIHEAYYDDSGHVGMITQDAISPYGETIEELRHAWVMMAEAFGQPILDDENIPEPGYDGVYERRADEARKELITGREMENIWESGDSEDLSEFYAEQETERIQREQQHEKEFVGIYPLKSLIDRIYEDYVACRDRDQSDEHDA